MSSSKQSGGHIKLARKMFDPEDLFWGDGTKFDSRSAWVDLIQLAAWKPYKYRGVDDLQRGEFVASVRYLAERWGWSKSAVQRWISRVQKAGRIAGRRVGHHGVVYLVVNYDTYQTAPAERGTLSGTHRGTKLGQERDKLEGSKAVKQLNPLGADAPGGGGESWETDFSACWAIYPKRVGGNPRHDALKAYRARRRDGVGADELLAGVQRYAAWCERSGKLATPYVMRAATFFGPALRFTEDWADAATPAKPVEKTALQELEELGAQDPWWTEGLEAARRKRAA